MPVPGRRLESKGAALLDLVRQIAQKAQTLRQYPPTGCHGGLERQGAPEQAARFHLIASVLAEAAVKVERIHASGAAGQGPPISRQGEIEPPLAMIVDRPAENGVAARVEVFVRQIHAKM